MPSAKPQYVWTEKDADAIRALLAMKREGNSWFVVPPPIVDRERVRRILRATDGFVADVSVPPQPAVHVGFHTVLDPETFYAGLVVSRPDLAPGDRSFPTA